MYGYIYKILCVPENKIYVGKHKWDKDYLDPNYWGSGTIITRKIIEYGKENFTREILEWVDSKEGLLMREEYWIQFLNARSPEIGYNIMKNASYGSTGLKKITNGNEVRYVLNDKLQEFVDAGWQIVFDKTDYKKEYYKKHKQRLLAKSKAWGKINKERKLDINRKSIAARLDSVKAYHKDYNVKYRLEHKEQNHKRQAQYYQEHKEERRQKLRDWRAKQKSRRKRN